ncbi:MAG: hypothetical protein WBC92_13225 [Terracidiphilus sp.]
MSADPAPRLLAVFGLLACCFAPALAQETSPPAQDFPAQDMGRIHGRVINPMGQPQTGGAISLSTDGGATLTYTFPVSATGDYSGEASLGEYTLVYRAADTPAGKIVDYIQGVIVLAGKDVAQDDDMTRQDYIDRLTPEQQQQLQKAREAANNAAVAANNLVTTVNADLQVVNQDLQDAANARATAIQTLGTGATPQDIDAKTAEIENAKYTEAETLMTKDTAAEPDGSVLWIGLARAETGLKNYLDAETNFKKALAIESKVVQREPEILGAAESGLGEVYARTLMVDEANAAFDAAAKADPPHAAMYLRNQAVIFFEASNSTAQVDAAEKAIKADPTDAFLYYLKAQGLAQNAPFDAAADKSILSPDCIAAYHKYLELAPTGPLAAEVTTALERSEEKPSAASAAPQN